MKRLEMAIQMELDGQQYYLHQADRHVGKPLEQVFRILAQTEFKHAQLLRQVNQGFELDLDEHLAEHPVDPFAGLLDFEVDAGYTEDQLEVYRLARSLEQQSITLYQDILDAATRPEHQRILTFLVRQEQNHLALFETLETLLQRPQDWVESAEFGNREEY